jgi:hypothetical protein
MTRLITAFFLAASTTLCAQDRPAGEQRWLLLGTPAAEPVQVPGITGRLGLQAPIPCPPGLGATVAAQLDRLRRSPELLPLGVLHFQVLSRAAESGDFRLGDVMQLALGTDAEACSVLPAAGGPQGPAASEIVYPTVKTIEITLRSEPDHTLWTRYLTFTNYRDATKRVPIAFARKSGLTWAGTVDAEALATLQSLADTGNRSYWDDMKLENRGGSTALDIGRLKIVLHYEKSASYEEDVPIVDSTLNRTLAAGYAAIDLDSYALSTRKGWGGIHWSMHPVLQLAGGDFGKCGSDGADGYGTNPKFGGSDNNLCSEFVSWYFHQGGLEIGGEDFRHITSTSQIDAAFNAAGRRYDYNNYYQEWIHNGSCLRYTPRPGDFLARRYDGEYQHSMIVLEWDDATKTMTVINGPWPVTLRRVAIQDLEEDGYDFRVGKIQ